MRRAEELQEWIAQVTEQPVDDDHLSVVLQDGQLLCLLANGIDPSANLRINKLTTVFHSKANIRLFLDWCRRQGLRDQDLFDPDDLLDGSDFVAVVNTLSILCDRFGGHHIAGGTGSFDENPLSDSESHTSSGSSSNDPLTPKKKGNNKLTSFMKSNFLSRKKSKKVAQPIAPQSPEGTPPSTPPPMSPDRKAVFSPKAAAAPPKSAPAAFPNSPKQNRKASTGSDNKLRDFMMKQPPASTGGAKPRSDSGQRRGNYIRRRQTYWDNRPKRVRFSLEEKRGAFMHEQLQLKEEQLRLQAQGTATKQNLIVAGVQCYVPDKEEVWMLSEIVDYNERSKEVTIDAFLDSGDTERRVVDLRDPDIIRAVAGPTATELESLPVAILHDTPGGVEDMRLLRYLNEPSILFNLKQRFEASKPLEAVENRDALAKTVYSKMFDWMVERINSAISSDENEIYGQIGVLDIFGFEDFMHNGFEQFCINYANEKLQQKFTTDVFKTVEEEYIREGLEWDHIQYQDNKDIVEIIDGKMGIIALMNDHLRQPRGTEEALVNKVKTNHHKKGDTVNPHIDFPKSFWLRAIRGENNDKTNSSRSTISQPRESSSHRFAPWSWFSSTSSVSSSKTDVSSQQPPDSGRSDQTPAVAPIESQRIAGPTLGSVLMRIHQNDGDVTELDFSYLTRKNKRFLAHGGELVARVLMTNRTVKRLVMREHAIGDHGAIAIAELLRHNTTLEYIDLYSNDITDVGAEALAAALYGHESLVHLSLWSNMISNRGAAAFANALRHNRRLQYLGLVHNRITNDGAQALLDALSINVTLETLNLATNRVSAAISSQIRVALAKNRVEAPRLMKQMTADEEDVERRLSSLRSSLIWEDVDAVHEDDAADYEDDDDDASSDCSGFLSADDNESVDEKGQEDDSADESLWI
ncbi:hypothetical protein ATCC90586_006589 [Pythium insidiosum]|nr:hypothetical protein ATCC90586_006589 [Pythium insidiosum]